MTVQASLSFQKTAPDNGLIYLAGKLVGEIRQLELFRFHPDPEEPPLVGDIVGIPLFWRQYHGHQEPERSANENRELSIVESSPHGLRLKAFATTISGTAESIFHLRFKMGPGGRVSCEVKAEMNIVKDPGWLVTPHEDHGEVTFATLWPHQVFSAEGTTPKRFQYCLLEKGNSLTRIEHNHLSSPDKKHIELGPGDRFSWVLEKLNPVIAMGPDTYAEAGICAYMWDTHFGLKLCHDGQPVTLPVGTTLNARYSLTAETRNELHPRVGKSSPAPRGEALDMPVWTGGHHTFQESFLTESVDQTRAWPWETCIENAAPDTVQFKRDTRTGYQDHCSLFISSRGPAEASWRASTIGPSFGERPFHPGVRLQLSAMVRTRQLDGFVQLALRVHREGIGSVFDVAFFDLFKSSPATAPDQDWTRLELQTPSIKPAPDRVHVLLMLNGKGSVWFDDVDFLRIP